MGLRAGLSAPRGTSASLAGEQRHEVANLAAYRITFLVAAAVCLAGVASALTIRDADAAATIPARRGRRVAAPEADEASAAAGHAAA